TEIVPVPAKGNIILQGRSPALSASEAGEESVDASLGDFRVLGRRARADADTTDHVTVDADRQATGNDHQAAIDRRIDAIGRRAGLAGCAVITRRLARTGSGEGLVDSDGDRGDLAAI